jgi:choline dehydrogenase
MHDVIIVGGGTAGCVLAERLTRSGKRRVLLVEAGGKPANRFVSIPAGFPRLFRSEVDWGFESEPQRALAGRTIFTPRGKMLGGCSNMNAMVHQWCHPADFDGWAASGATGWGWNDVLPEFRAQERWGGDDGDPGRGRSGPMRVEPNRNARSLSRHFVEAARRAGLPEESRYNGHAYAGAWIPELAHRDGRRFSAYDACLEPAMSRGNLEIVSDAVVTTVEVAEGRATGVVFRRAGTEHTRAARAVVLAAGAYASPQLLMLSGIGPASTLGEFGIPVRVDAPEVGENLQDHPVLPLVFRTSSDDTLLRAESIPQLLRYLLLRRGMLASNGVEGMAFTQVRPGPVAAPDLEILFLPLEFRRQFLEPPREHAFSLAAAVVAPLSRGRVILRSRDPLVPPGIDPDLLSDPEGIDASVLWEGVRLCRKIAATDPLAGQNLGEIRPGAAVESEDDLLAYAGTEIQTVYHPSSTCRMGSDSRSVVDPRLRVRGVEGLWVVDASVMPSVPRGHPHAVVAMIANRAAAWIDPSVGA